MNGFLSRILYVLIIIFTLSIPESFGIRCYSCFDCDVSSGYDIKEAKVIEECIGRCRKTTYDGVVTRGCSPSVRGSANICDAAPQLTICYCKTDLCNAAPSGGCSLFILFPVLGFLLSNVVF